MCKVLFCCRVSRDAQRMTPLVFAKARDPRVIVVVTKPDNTSLAYKTLQMSPSQIMMPWIDMSGITQASLLTELCWSNTSGHRKCSALSVMMLPSVSSSVLPFSKLSAVDFSPVLPSSAM